MYSCVLDFESASAVDLKSAGAARYWQDPTTEVLSLGWQITDGRTHGPKRQWRPDKDDASFPAHLAKCLADPDCIFVAHNAEFEISAWTWFVVPVLGWPDIPTERWHDSMAVCAHRALPLGLDRATTVLGLLYLKDTAASKHTIGLSKPFADTKANRKAGIVGKLDRTAASLDRSASYNLSDIDAQVGLHERIGWLPPGERRVWELDRKINNRGVALDLEFVRAAQKIVDDSLAPLEQEFAQETGGLHYGQTQAIMKWLVAQGVWNVPNLQKETLAELLGEDDSNADADDRDVGRLNIVLPPRVERALAIRQLAGSTSIKKLASMETCVGFDGRARGLLQYHAAATGRWGGRLLQPHNFPRGTVKVGGKAPEIEPIVAAIKTGDADYVRAIYGDPIQTVVSTLRHAIVAGPGRSLVAGDFAQIEARIILAVAGQADKLEVLRNKQDIYIDMAQQIYKRPIDKEKDPEERQTGKNSVLGLGFNMGGPTFQRRYAKNHPIEFCNGVVQTYRKEWAPLVPLVWQEMEKAALNACRYNRVFEAYGVQYKREDRWLTARLPSGRKLWYFNPRVVDKEMKWSTEENPDIRLAWTYQSQKMGQWAKRDAYGGLLAENVVQAIARDLMVDAMFRCEENGFPIILTVHDQIITEPESWMADEKVLEQILADVPEWARYLQLPIASECWTGERFRK